MFFKKRERESLVDLPIKFGDLFYSQYFKCNGVVVANAHGEWFSFWRREYMLELYKRLKLRQVK